MACRRQAAGHRTRLGRGFRAQQSGHKHERGDLRLLDGQLDAGEIAGRMASASGNASDAADLSRHLYAG